MSSNFNDEAIRNAHKSLLPTTVKEWAEESNKERTEDEELAYYIAGEIEDRVSIVDEVANYRGETLQEMIYIALRNRKIGQLEQSE